MTAARAPSFARLLVGASLALSLIPLGFGVQAVGEWREQRAGRSIREQRASFRNVAWFRTEFTDLADRLAEVVPADARVLVEPLAAPGGPRAAERGVPPPRWYLALAHYAWPLRVYVRQPEWAATFFTYERWLDHHLELLDGGTAPEEERAIDELGIEWRLRIPAWPFEMGGLRLDRRIDGAWVEQPDFPRPEWGA